MKINIPEAHAEVTAAFWRYTTALLANDIDTVIELFWSSAHTLRYGLSENLYGMEAIAAFRQGPRGVAVERQVTHLVVTSFGTDFGTANSELLSVESGETIRMSHSWVRFGDGWRIVAAHVSAGPNA